VLVNLDDDNENGIPDGTEAGPILGEDDLEPFLIKWAPANRPEEPIRNYFGWNLTLVLHGSGVQLWSHPDKTGPQMLQQYPPGWGLNWVIGVDPIPSTLYLEALSSTTPGGIQLDLLLTSPQWSPTDGDTVVFTALYNLDTEVDLIIFDGLQSPYGGGEVSNRDEDVTGAVTIANMNDTDADRIKDSDDDDVRENRMGKSAHGRNEVDLMTLVAKKPKGYTGGPVTIEVTAGVGRVKLWKFSYKKELVDGFNPATGVVTFDPWVGGDKTMWVEITTPSETVADVAIKMTYGPHSDTVKATAVWATVERDFFETKDWADLPTSPWKDEMDEKLQELVRDNFGGTGVRPVRVDVVHAWALNAMLMEFTVTPPKVVEILTRVKFDITRQRKNRTWATTDADPFPKLKQKVDLPAQWEKPNDDVADDKDESDKPNSKGHMYVVDGPGVAPPRDKTDTNKWWVEDTFFEYMRVGFGKRPTGNDVQGGQCSGNIGWHSLTTITWSDFLLKWVRTPRSEGGMNEIKRGWLEIDDLPP
jgi:hypothetical protein